MIAACPGRDCWNREGPRWTAERLFNDREAELKERVDRRRVRLVQAGASDRATVARELMRFRDEVVTLEPTARDVDLEMDAECEVPEHAGLEVDTGIRR